MNRKYNKPYLNKWNKGKIIITVKTAVLKKQTQYTKSMFMLMYKHINKHIMKSIHFIQDMYALTTGPSKSFAYYLKFESKIRTKLMMINIMTKFAYMILFGYSD